MAKLTNKGFYHFQDNFYESARPLRQTFDQRFQDPLSTSNQRFVWDYWHVPDQYTLVRTPAYHFFPKKIYKSFHESLLRFGRENLGCYNITPPWLSYYVDGCEQQLHADVPHGPWAFVFSLTNWTTREFEGGETLLLKPATLDYWSHFSNFSGVEQDDLVVDVAPKFNRLLIFDPRIPHGVKPVRGIRDPRKARLVIHGWFTEPEVYIEGALTRRQATSALNEIIETLSEKFRAIGLVHGTLTLRFQIDRTGKVSSFFFPTDRLVSLEQNKQNFKSLLREIKSQFLKSRFPKSRGSTRVTLPLLFRL